MKRVKTKIKGLAKKHLTKCYPVNIPVYEGKLLDGKTALITGGGSGIGFSIAQGFLRQGCKKVIITGTNEQKLITAKNKIGGGIEYLLWDLSVLSDLDAKFDMALSLAGGHIDILVNNAGYHGNQIFGTITESDYDSTFDINQKAVFFLSQKVFNYFKENSIHGNILIISSASSAKPAWSPYEISKWGARGFTRGLAREAIEYGVTVNGIAPGPTVTPMSKIDLEADGIGFENLPQKRWIMPEEIANLAVFMTSDMGRCIIGDTVFLDGGSGTISINK